MKRSIAFLIVLSVTFSAWGTPNPSTEPAPSILTEEQVQYYLSGVVDALVKMYPDPKPYKTEKPVVQKRRPMSGMLVDGLLAGFPPWLFGEWLDHKYRVSLAANKAIEKLSKLTQIPTAELAQKIVEEKTKYEAAKSSLQAEAATKTLAEQLENLRACKGGYKTAYVALCGEEYAALLEERGTLKTLVGSSKPANIYKSTGFLFALLLITSDWNFSNGDAAVLSLYNYNLLIQNARLSGDPTNYSNYLTHLEQIHDGSVGDQYNLMGVYAAIYGTTEVAGEKPPVPRELYVQSRKYLWDQLFHRNQRAVIAINRLNQIH